MKFEHDGRTLWYGTPDALAPGETVAAGTEIVITIGVSPIDASNKVELLYRLNQGSAVTVAAKWVQNDTVRQAQYFRATLPALRAGDVVEYLPINGCAGCQFPSPAELTAFPSSFRVVEATAPLSAGLTLNRSFLAHNLSNPSAIKPESFAAMRPLSSIDASVTDTPAVPVRSDLLTSTATHTHIEPSLSAAFDPSITAVSPVITDSAAGVSANPSISVSPNIPITPSQPVSPGNSASSNRSLSGQIILDQGVPAAGLTLRVYNRGFGGEAKVAEFQTDANGHYLSNYSLGTAAANLEVRAVDPQGKEISLSDTLFNAGQTETMNLVAPSNLIKSIPEFTLLSSQLSPHVNSFAALAQAREDDQHQDITTLSVNTRIDARLITLAVDAAKASLDIKANTNIELPVDTLYTLYRVGLPRDTQQLAWVSPQVVEQALGKAKEAGIIALDDQQIAAVKTSFDSVVRQIRLATKAPGALSSIGEMLGKVSLAVEDTNKFADIYFEHRGTAAELWEKAKSANISDEVISKLKLQGKLSYLTLNNAELAASLHQEIGSEGNLAKLVEADLYQNAAWKSRLIQMAGNDEALQKIIPPAYISDKTDPRENLNDRLDAYAEDLARKVRLSYPAQVVRRMIENGPDKGGLSLGENHEAIKTPVTTFLKNAESLGFVLGQTPVEAFIKQNEQPNQENPLFQGISSGHIKNTIESAKTLQRLYQTSPSDASLKVLLNAGFKSAQDIVAFSHEKFLDRYGPLFPSREEATVVYRKAEQVSVVTHNFFTMAKLLDSAPPVNAMTSPAHIREEAKTNLIKQFPTMESLFGSLDFCECEHCRSVLSPAAYFVDLLQFLDPSDLIWGNFLKDWQEKHNGKAYDGSDYNFKKPYDALIERRPDLPHLQLTCENTQTALPYIDIVNEILEYYVANDKLSDEAAHDTGDATSAELLAEPQNIVPKAYEALNAARYPLNLPFDLWLETVRRFLEHFETPLWKVLETFRQSNELFEPTINPKPYHYAEILAEYLDISPSEYRIFTEAKPLAQWFELYGYATNTEALAALISAKTLSRKLGVTYKEITDIVQTSFVNPELDGLSIIWRLHLGIGEVVGYFKDRDKQEFADKKKIFEERLTALLKETSSDLKLEGMLAKLNDLKGGWQKALVLRDTSALCDFDQTTLQFADPADPAKPYADALVFYKINLFVRLWKKLGWTMEETDRALQIFVPQNSLPLTETNIGEALKTALVYIAHLKALDERVKAGKNSRLKFLSLWSNLSTTGKNPLYRQLFLTRSVLKADPVFDDPLGNYLGKSGLFVKDHHLALQSALSLTSEEIDRILTDTGKTAEKAELSLNTLSLLYRYGLLAKALKLPVRELIVLKNLSGLNPFTPLSADPLTKIEDDHPFNQTLQFVEIAELIKTSGFTIEDIDYLLRHRFDPVGKYRLTAEVPLALVKSLANEIQRIKTEHAIPDDPATLTDEVLRQKLALALPSEVAETFFAMWAGTKEYEAFYPESVSLGDQLDPETFSKEPSIRVNYDKVRQKQRLSYKGVLLDAQKVKLKADFPSQIIATLLDAVQQQANDFFKKYLEKSTVGAQPTGFLEAGDFETLFAPIADGLSESEQQSVNRKKRDTLAKSFLPFLQRRLIRQLIVQTLTADLSTDPLLTEVLLTEANLITDPGKHGKPLVDAFEAAGGQGVSVTFFASIDGSGDPTPSTVGTVNSVSTSLKDENNQFIRPNNAQSAQFEGYFEVPTAGPYRFFMAFGKKDTEGELLLYTPAEVAIRHKAGIDHDEISGPGDFVELKPGVPYRFRFNARNLNGGDASLIIQGETLPKGSLSQLTLYSHTTIDRIRRIRILLSKAFQLILGFGLAEREVRYLLTHKADFGGLDLSKLPSEEITDGTQQFKWFLRLVSYARLKNDLASNSDDLIHIFETNEINEQDKCIGNLTRRDVNTIQATKKAMGLAISDLRNEQGLQRLWDGLQLVEKLGVPVEAIARWTNIVKLPKSPAEEKSRTEIARDLKDTVKARYEQENWQGIAQPIFDKLRQRQRDALVGYIMHRDHFDRMEQLFEYFLIDPGMEPVVQTSRIRLAISSVQVFIQRCLLNLEKYVHPAAVNSKQWQWMKRYRVWEANRKIFLFPENWLEPEFRDDKTHLFQELESALLQGDVSNDLAEDAFFQYLNKLKELANLDIVTMYYEGNPDPSLNKLHVIGRTSNTPYKYFYHRYAHQIWTPWEPVTTEIDGDHIVAVMWRDRLHLFWVTFMVKAKQDNSPPTVLENASVGKIFNTAMARVPQLEIQTQLHWSEYFEGQWTTRASSGFSQPFVVEGGGIFNSNSVFIHISEEKSDDPALNIHLTYPADKSYRFVSKHSQPELFEGGALQQPLTYQPNYSIGGTKYQFNGALATHFAEKIVTENKNIPSRSEVTKQIFSQARVFTLLTTSNPVTFPSFEIGNLVKPIFYKDDLYTFFVEPSLTETTIEKWEEWVITPPSPVFKLDDDWWKFIVPNVQIPKKYEPTYQIDPRAKYGLGTKGDWLINHSTVLQFGDRVIGQTGGLHPSVLSTGTLSAGIASSINNSPNTTMISSVAASASSLGSVAANNLRPVGLNVIGSSGLSSALVNNTGAIAGTGVSFGRDFGELGSVRGIINR